jgi:hypothetical protein
MRKIIKFETSLVFSYCWLIPLLLTVLVLFGCGGGGGSSNNNGANEDANVDPVASASVTPSPVDELTAATLDGTGSSDSDGNIVSYSWTQVGLPAVNITNPTAEIAGFTAPAVTVETDLTFQLTVTDDDSASDTDEITVTVMNAGILSGSAEVSPDIVTLGSDDFAHYGKNDVNSFNHLDGVTQQIGVDVDGTPLVAGYEQIDVDLPTDNIIRQSTGRDVAFNWSSGTPDPTGDNTQTGLRLSTADGLSVGDGFRVRVVAGVAAKTVKVYVGGFSGETTVTATLSDGSAAPVTVVLDNPLLQHKTWCVTLNFAAAADGETLDIDVTHSDDTGDPGAQVNLVALNLN